MSPVVGARLRSLPPYPMAGIKKLRMEMEARGVDVIDLGAGDADLSPPPAVVAALASAAKQPHMSRYPFQVGLVEFRQAVASWMDRRFGVEVDPMAELLPLIGSKEGIAHMPLAFLDPGDAAIIPDPGYQGYRGPVVLAGGEAHLVPLKAADDFLIPLDSISEDVLRRAKILYLNYPNNPTTATAPPEYYREAIELCHAHDIILLHDIAYSEMAFDGYRPPSILEIEGARQVAIEFHSLSKTYNMTGWRLGWAVGNPELVSALSRVKTFMDTGVFLAVQAAGVAALESWEKWVPSNVAVFQSRRDGVVKVLGAAGFDFIKPRATMYVWIAVPDGEPSASFASRALEQEGVVVIPGAALGDGGEGYFRIALTLPEERLREAVERLARVHR